MLRSYYRILPYWSGDGSNEFYGHFLGISALGLMENNLHSVAQENIGRSLSYSRSGTRFGIRLGRSNAANIGHSSSAVISMLALCLKESKNREGIRFLRETRDIWEPMATMTPQFECHRALFLLDLGDYDGTFRAFDNGVFPLIMMEPHEKFDNVIGDAASALWQIKLAGVSDEEARQFDSGAMRMTRFFSKAVSPSHGATITTRFQSLLTYTFERRELNKTSKIPTGLTLFQAMHWAILLAGAERLDLFDDLFHAMGVTTDSQQLLIPDDSYTFILTSSHFPVISDENIMSLIGIPLIRSFYWFAKRNYSQTVRDLLHIRAHLPLLLGGRSAQRDIIDQTLLVASAFAAGIDDSGIEKRINAFDNSLVPLISKEDAPKILLTKALAAERVSQKPYSPQSWMWNARILRHAGDIDQAAAANSRALDLGMGQGKLILIFTSL
jgi:hypothetical protein